MDEEFRFTLKDEEKQALKDLVRVSIAQRLLPDDGIELPKAPNARLRQQLGVFVTLKANNRLRGCIGHIVGDNNLWDTVADMAKAAAFEDPRFSPLSDKEFLNLDIEISVLSPLSQCPDPQRIEIGRHGLLITMQGHSGLLLPQVPVEWNWDRETFLVQTCRKAGLPDDSWQDSAATLYWFEAEVF